MNLRERNLATIKKAVETTPEVKSFMESLKRRTGLDASDPKTFPVHESGFSWKAVKEKCELKEADASSAFVQFLRAGIQTLTNSMYQSHPTTFEEWVTVIQSKLDTELYPTNQGIGFPRQIGYNELYPEVGAAALDLQLKNLKFGTVYAVQKELLENDQSGSFQAQAGRIGEYMKLLAEVLCYGKLASVANMQYIDYKIPTSETKPSYEATWPYSQALRGGGKNRPASFGALSATTIQAGRVALMNQKNLQGIKMSVQPKRLIVGPNNELDAATILNSTWYPSNLAGVAGAPGQVGAVNFLKGLLQLTVSPYVFKNDGTVAGDSKAWWIADDGKPFFVLQLREVATVEQEAVNSGESFNRDIYRFKGRSQMNADFIDSRFVWQGNDGSITT
jgi:hypothetical protein